MRRAPRNKRKTREGEVAHSERVAHLNAQSIEGGVLGMQR
jgi:hypothetical protein